MSGTTNVCRTCQHWDRYEDKEGRCYKIIDKALPNVIYGWDGGYIDGIDTDADFGCTLHEEGSND